MINDLTLALIGAFYLGLPVYLLLKYYGKVVGISGIIKSCILEPRDSKWKLFFLSGLLSAGLLLRLFTPALLGYDYGQANLPRFALGGFLVGYGARKACGCTSGHMLCGLSRLSIRSIFATLMFFTNAMIAVYLFPNNSVWSDNFQFKYSTLFLSLIFLIFSVIWAKKIMSTSLNFAAFYAGLLFGTGLGLTGMVKSSSVLGFLSIFSEPSLFNPNLLMIILGAIAPNLVAYRREIRKMKKPVLEDEFATPSKCSVDTDLIIGSSIFGFGWGLCGICPGPALIQLFTFQSQIYLFVLTMITGLLIK
ncbi:hypothetical protein ROZALSC1DRAFT_26815 [Rozella allomycis CSF55]|uniref:Uncharacterized protein n=1 Tax=Rozella allomycis (strain CSF55) TaxID=988480 RepID=A0A075AY44_ROZAC|nr:hypothetical protein O9G_004188 [Rozella allomycis CSF55]RKP21791.1 hypothetical protein ROZALSC1DRAFT_26815 [Rozella allomycis CSF55]|eukprot:EPZ35177.1 hypothetical protein O9G_004188 [Rozella allomycis CSF55]